MTVVTEVTVVTVSCDSSDSSDKNCFQQKKDCPPQKNNYLSPKSFLLQIIFHKKTCFTEEPKSSQKKLFFYQTVFHL